MGESGGSSDLRLAGVRARVRVRVGVRVGARVRVRVRACLLAEE